MTISPLVQPKAGMPPPPSLRVLVLGSDLHYPGITSYAWSGLPCQLNVTDYDVVILNLVSFLEQQADAGIRPERLPPWQQLARLLFSASSEIICIGIPDMDTGNRLYSSMTWWMPVMPEFVLHGGEVMQQVKDDYAYYFDQVRRWFFYVTPKFRAHFLGLEKYLRVIHPELNHLQVGMGAIASTRLQQPIGFKLMFRARQGDRQRSLSNQAKRRSPQPNGKATPTITSGTAIWLPPPTEISTDDAIRLIVQHRYQRSIRRPVPDWATAYQLPEQVTIAAKLQQQQQAIAKMTAELAQTQRQLAQAAELNRLIYESDATLLADVVADTLRQLGAGVNRQSAVGQSALRLVSLTGAEALVLVCTQPEAVQPNQVRHLDQEVRGQMMQHNWQGKGILIANPYHHQPPDQRLRPFSSACIRAAQQCGYCLLTTTQLFEAIAAYQRQELDAHLFWGRLFETQGICAMPTSEPQVVSSFSGHQTE